VLQHTATHCNTFQTATQCREEHSQKWSAEAYAARDARTLLRFCFIINYSLYTLMCVGSTAIVLLLPVVLKVSCNTLQRAATHCTTTPLLSVVPTVSCNALQHTAARCNTLQHAALQQQSAAPQCNTLQHTAMQHPANSQLHPSATRCDPPQCNTAF